MKAIVSPEWYPVTHDFGVIQAPTEMVANSLVKWRQRLGIELTVAEVRSSLEVALNQLPPLTAIMGKFLLVGLRNGWTALFQNGILGSDPFPPMSYLAHTILDTTAMRICCSPDGNMWEVYSPARLGGSEPLGFHRTLYACRNDSGRWEFGQSGEPFPFEDLSQYARRKIRDRFNDDLFAQYLRAFGLEVFDPGFFVVNENRPAVILKRSDIPGNFPQFSVQEVREGKPWKK